MKKVNNKGFEKIQKMNAIATKLQIESGFIVRPKSTKKVFILPRTKAISIASDRLHSKNISNTMDGVESLAKINQLATKIQKEKGTKEVVIPAQKVYKLNRTIAMKKAKDIFYSGLKKK